jgi:ADP-ribose pyrophosphatase YjhB (NUDIX family)
MAGPSPRLRRLARLPRTYARAAFEGLFRHRLGNRPPLVVYQGVVVDAGQVLLALRSDVRGWELPGGNGNPGESGEEALRRELREETGLEVEVERRVGDYVRSGFWPHTARVYRCRLVGGTLRRSRETPDVRWFPLAGLPAGLLPWYRQPLADALAGRPEPVLRRERWGLREIAAAMAIDLRSRWRG